MQDSLFKVKYNEVSYVLKTKLGLRFMKPSELKGVNYHALKDVACTATCNARVD